MPANGANSTIDAVEILLTLVRYTDIATGICHEECSCYVPRILDYLAAPRRNIYLQAITSVDDFLC